ncbi:TetR/AcrR family transcriptional regulator [Actinacidiphila oryziradicis]|jgi:AcrR family transcriptional regulator|uniref:TetR/AcrR family transcriptional regulator n=1 Tax=Actinacidiphila oryziradicis TaxID=2571141 RepID=A0A4U0SM26_9ACTN|nr:TetR/AcrR family transcriptional regulator [Actinacidiphila oryziradicis]
MARRGDTLREHILEVAKNAFLESGFERTSMDALAVRAETSKRSLYAHFPTKDALFLAVIDRVHDLFRGRMRTPDHYAGDPAEATALFCGRFLQMLGWAPVLQTCRMGITEAERLPEAAAQLHEVFFGATTDRLAAYLSDQYGLDAAEGATLAARLLGMTVYPTFPRALFGIGELRDNVPDEASIEADVDMTVIRRATASALLRRRDGNAAG